MWTIDADLKSMSGAAPMVVEYYTVNMEILGNVCQKECFATFESTCEDM